jgi:hypothetical protein
MRLGTPITLSGRVARFGSLLTHEKEQLRTILLVALDPPLYGRDHCWLLQGRTLDTRHVQIGDRVTLRARPRCYTRKDASVSIGLAAPSAVRITKAVPHG